jgi:hypothetical protein
MKKSSFIWQICLSPILFLSIRSPSAYDIVTIIIGGSIMSDLSANSFGCVDRRDHCGNNGIFLILILLCCCNGNGGLFGGRNDCDRNNGCEGIIFIILILCLCGNSF